MKNFVFYFIVLFACHQLCLNNKGILCNAKELEAPTTIAPTNVTNLENHGKCECGAFDMVSPGPKDCPIIKYSPMEVPCNETGSKKCKDLCLALSQAVQEQAPQFLCEKLHHIDKLKASVLSRICEAPLWTYSGLTSDEICCHSYKPVSCILEVPKS